MIDLTKLSSHYIVRELGEADVDKVLEICQGNPQSSHFWKKNGFGVIAEADVNGRTKSTGS